MPKMTSGSSHSAPRMSPAGNIACGKSIRIALAIAEAMKAASSAVGDHADVRLVGGRELLGEAALQPQGGELGGELDDDDRISEAAEQLRPVEAPGDEQEGQPRGEPQQEAEEIGPPALGQSGDVLVGAGRRSRSMRGAPVRRRCRSRRRAAR